MRQTRAAQHGQRRHRDDRVHHQRDAQRQRNGAGDGARRIADLLTQGRDPRVTGEREKQQSRPLQHPVGARVGADAERPKSVLGAVNATTAIAANAASTTAR